MKENKEQDTLQKMLEIGELIENAKESQDVQVGTISYYKDFTFQGSNLAETDIFIAKIENTAENTTTYEIYSSNANTLIATVDGKGKLQFMPKYRERLKKIDEKYAQTLNLEDLDFVLPKELGKEDKVLSREERQYISSKKKREIQDKREVTKRRRQRKRRTRTRKKVERRRAKRKDC